MRCTRCGKETGGQEIAAYGHFWEKKSDAVAATCTEAGREAVTACSRCGEERGGVEVSALGHDYSGGKCARCGEAAPSQEHEHSYGWVTVEEPTCTLSVIGEYKCTVCGAYPESYPECIDQGRNIIGEPLGHDYSLMEVCDEGSCTRTSKVKVHCSRCGQNQFTLNEKGEATGLVRVDTGLLGPHGVSVSNGGEYYCGYCAKEWGKRKPSEAEVNETVGKPAK